MAFWASAAWGQEALGVDVETSRRLDLVVKALLLVGAYMDVSAVERSNASWMAGPGYVYVRVCMCVPRGECHIIEEGLHGSRGGRSAEGGLCQKDV